MHQAKLGKTDKMKGICMAKKINCCIFLLWAIVTLRAGMTFAAQPVLVAWQTSRGFVKDMTVDAVQFAKTNGFDYVKLEVDKNTDLRPLL